MHHRQGLLEIVALCSALPWGRSISTEILGFPLTDSLCTELESIDLRAIQQQPAPNILVIESHDEVRAGGMQEHLARRGIPVEYHHLPSPPIWLEIANRGLVPHQLLQSLVTWMSEVYP